MRGRSVWLVWTELLAHSSAAERRRGLGSVLVCPGLALLLEETEQTLSQSIKRLESESAGCGFCRAPDI